MELSRISKPARANRFGRALTVLRRDGARAFVFRVLGETVYRRLLVVSTNLQAHRFAADARCRWLAPNEADVYAKVDPSLTTDEVRRRLAKGERCYVLADGEGSIAHGMWVATGRAWIDYLQVEMPLAADEAYLYQSYTAPAHRGKRYATISAVSLKYTLRQEGVLRTLACIQPDNALAFPPVYRARAVPISYIGWIGIGRWRRAFTRATTQFPRHAPKPRESPSDG